MLSCWHYCFYQSGETFFNILVSIKNDQGFPGGAVVENLPANAGDTGSSPETGKIHMPRSN